MDQKIWFEIAHSKKGEIFLAYYLVRQKDVRKYFKMFTIIFSVGGVLGWSIWGGIFAVIACGLIAIMELVGKLETHLIRSEADIESIGELRCQYIRNLNKLEKLYVDYRAKRLNEEQATNQFFEIRELTTETEALDNRLNINPIKKLSVKADKEANDYLNQYYLNNYNVREQINEITAN